MMATSGFLMLLPLVVIPVLPGGVSAVITLGHMAQTLGN